jgi:hypothetical protein
MKAMYEKIDVLGPTSPDLCVHPPGAVCVLRRHQLRVLTESADQLIEPFILRFCLARLTTEGRIAMAGRSRSGQMVLW